VQRQIPRAIWLPEALGAEAQSSIKNYHCVNGPSGSPSRASGARLWPPRCSFPLPGSVIDAPPGRLASEHILGIYVSRECLARRALHRHVALRGYISLIRDVERREPRDTIVDGQSRCYREIWASRSTGAHVLGETTNVGSIVESRRRWRGSRCVTRRRHRCSGWRGLLWGAGSDRETG